VRSLSGGERNRLLLARLFAQPANLLVLDEPTNDLDVETLELLEELLLEYPGTLLVVSHDREFLDNVITSALVFEGDGVLNEYVGGYSDWLRQRQPAAVQAQEKSVKPRAAAAQPDSNRRPARLTYKDRRELDGLPARIEALESQQAGLQAAVNAPEFYQQGHAQVAAALDQLAALAVELEACYARWAELES
jgi:ATP-binding cassette subfamily F protein uup